jgi:hypothetical protein
MGALPSEYFVTGKWKQADYVAVHAPYTASSTICYLDAEDVSKQYWDVTGVD